MGPPAGRAGLHPQEGYHPFERLHHGETFPGSVLRVNEAHARWPIVPRATAGPESGRVSHFLGKTVRMALRRGSLLRSRSCPGYGRSENSPKILDTGTRVPPAWFGRQGRRGSCSSLSLSRPLLEPAKNMHRWSLFQGYLKIVDLGLAKIIPSGYTWTICGTPDLPGTGYHPQRGA